MRKTAVLSLCALWISSVSVEARESITGAWRTSLEVGLGLTQAAYSDNWTGGEVGSITWVATLHATAEKPLSDRFKWENELKLAYGQTHSQDEQTKDWAPPVKSTDKIRFDSILKLTLDLFADPYVAGVFQSQFYDPSVYTVKRYINPVELIESAGLSRTLVENESSKLVTRLGLGLRQYIDITVIDTLAGTTQFETEYDGGLEWVTDLSLQFSQTLSYTSKLSLFQALLYSEKDEPGVGDEWKTTDLIWENMVTARVTKIVQVNLSWELWYDEEISPAGRFKETLALGLAWVL